MRTFSALVYREKSHLPSWASNGSLTPLRQPKKFPDIPVSTRKEHRGSRHNSRRAPVFPSHPERRVHFPASSGKESLNSHRTSRGSGLNLTLEDSRSRATISNDPNAPMTPDTPDSPALTQRSPRGSTHNTMAGVTTLWHLERKPPIPMSTQQEA